MLPLTIERLDSSLVSALLSAEHGIGVCDGKFCAHILVDELLEDSWGDVPATAVRHVRVSGRPGSFTGDLHAGLTFLEHSCRIVMAGGTRPPR